MKSFADKNDVDPNIISREVCSITSRDTRNSGKERPPIINTIHLEPVNAVGPPVRPFLLLVLLDDKLLLFAAHFDEAPTVLRTLDAAPDVDLRAEVTALLRTALLRPA